MHCEKCESYRRMIDKLETENVSLKVAVDDMRDVAAEAHRRDRRMAWTKKRDALAKCIKNRVVHAPDLHTPGRTICGKEDEGYGGTNVCEECKRLWYEEHRSTLMAVGHRRRAA